MVCFLEKDIILGESHLYNDPRQTLDRSLVCNDMLVLYFGLSCQPGTSLHISHLRHANHLPADLQLQLTDVAAELEACALSGVTAGKGPVSLAYHGQRGQSSH